MNSHVQGIVVPQKVYTVSSSVALSQRDPIRFSSQSGAGVNLQNVISPSYHGLANGEQLVHLTDNGSISICIQVRSSPSPLNHERLMSSSLSVAWIPTVLEVYRLE